MTTYQDTRIITLNSQNAIKNNGSYNSDVKFIFTGLITEDADKSYIEISVLNAQIPYSFYTVNIYNNILKLQIGATVYTLTLTRGNYNANTLITEIKNQLTAQGITDINISISSITGCLTFTKTSGNFTLLYSGSTIFKVLGFNPAEDYTSTASILTAPYPLNLLGSLKLRIVSNDLQTANYDSAVNGSYNILAVLPIESGNFGLILYDNIAQIKNILKNPVVDEFNIKIIDDDGNLVNFNGQDWSICLTIIIHRDVIEKSKTSFTSIAKSILDIKAPEPDQPAEKATEQVEEETAQLVAEPINPEFDDNNDLGLLLYNYGQ